MTTETDTKDESHEEALHDEIYAKSPLTGNWYLVTEYEEKGDGKIVAKQKREVSREDVPEEWREATEEQMEARYAE